MSSGIHVFLGPSLPEALAREHLPDAELHPPIAMGELYCLVEDHAPKMVAIVDGFFEQKLAVWHKEILFALSKGVRVYGASSMGALRAAELNVFGMVGVGSVYEAFASGELEDDDEVTVAHGSAADGFRTLSEAMVNIRAALREAERRGLVSGATALALARMAKDTFYVERAWGRLWRDAAAAGLAEDEVARLRAFVSQEQPNAKRDDAVALLRRIAADRHSPPPPLPPTMDVGFEPTGFWRGMVRIVNRDRAAAASAEMSASEVSVWRHASLLPDREDIFRSCLLGCLLTTEARNRNLVVTDDQIAGAEERFRRRRRLLSGAAMERWMAENHMSREDFAAIARLEVVAEEIAGTFGRKSRLFRSLLSLELKRRGAFGAIVGDIERKQTLAADRRESAPQTPAAAEAKILEALTWYQETRRRITGNLEDHAMEMGFPTAPELLAEIMASHELAKGRR